MGLNANIGNRRSSTIGPDTYDIHNAEDINRLATANVITVDRNLTLVMQETGIISPVHYVVESGFVLKITSIITDAITTYSGSETFIGGAGSFIIDGGTLISSANAKLCEIEVETGFDFVQIRNHFNVGFGGVSTVTGTGAGSIFFNGISFFPDSGGISIIDVPIGLLRSVEASGMPASTPFFRISGGTNPLSYTFTSPIGNGDATASMLLVDNGIHVDSQMLITSGTVSFSMFDSAGIDQTDPRIIAINNPGNSPSQAKIELRVDGNALITNIPLAGAKVLINSSNWAATSQERFSLNAPDQAQYDGSEPVAIKLDGNILLEPSSSTKTLSCQFVRHGVERATVTFTNGTNIIDEVGHALIDNDNITFNDNAGTLPAELRADIIYYIVSAATDTFQVSYTQGGSAIAFTDNGSGTNSYATADLHGSIPKEPIAANSPRTLVPQALEDVTTGDHTFVVVTNEDDATNILVSEGYYRVVD